MTFYQRQIIEQAQLPYSPLAKAFEKTKQNKKQVGAMKPLDLYNKLKQTECEKTYNSSKYSPTIVFLKKCT